MSERRSRDTIVKTLPGFSIAVEPATLRRLRRMSSDLAARTGNLALEPAWNTKTEIARQVPLIEVDRIPLSDHYAMDLLSRERSSSDYHDGFTFFPSAIVNRRLFSPRCIERWQTTAREVEGQGVRDLGFINVRHNFSNVSSSDFSPHVFPERTNLSLPLETGVSYTYDLNGETIHVAGSPLFSVLHGLSGSGMSLSKELQQSMIEEYFGQYLQFLPDHDVTVLAIPPRKEDSPTHNAFAKYAVAHPLTGDIIEHTTFGERQVDLYFFAHGEGEVLKTNMERARRLMIDPGYRGVLEALDETRYTNFRSVTPNTVNELAENQERAICRFLAENSSVPLHVHLT